MRLYKIDGADEGSTWVIAEAITSAVAAWREHIGADAHAEPSHVSFLAEEGDIVVAKEVHAAAEMNREAAVTMLKAVLLDRHGRQRVVCPKCAHEWILAEDEATTPTDRS
jgi:hypothetical protein